MSGILERFNQVAGEYDEFTDKIPHYDRMMTMIGEIFEVWTSDQHPRHICELGTGTGKLSWSVVHQYEPEFFHGVDGAEEMITRTRERFADYEGPTRLRWECCPFESWDPDDGYDWIYSSLAIHHMSDPDKRTLLKTIYRVLNPGGRFLLCDLIRRPEERLDFYKELRRRRMMREGFSEEEFEQRWQVHVQNDVPARLEDLVTWIREIGFARVDCVWKETSRVILVADRP